MSLHEQTPERGASVGRKPIARPELLVDQIARRLVAEILTGQLMPGQRISTAGIAEDLQVSHIPVREALRRLEAEGLVQSIPHQRAIVAGVSLEELEELYELRQLIEADTAQRAAGRYTADDIAGIRVMMEEMLAADPEDHESDFWQLHYDFHWAVLRPGMDSWRQRLIRLLWQAAERYRRLFPLVGGSWTDSRADHAALAEAAASSDPELLREVLIRHLDRTRETVLRGYLAAYDLGESEMHGRGHRPPRPA
jgi:DNA-binding GntR family transcriptional regulator